jgi:hypothetical protein
MLYVSYSLSLAYRCVHRGSLPPPAVASLPQAGVGFQSIGNGTRSPLAGRTMVFDEGSVYTCKTSDAPRYSFTAWMDLSIALSGFLAIAGTMTGNLGKDTQPLTHPTDL